MTDAVKLGVINNAMGHLGEQTFPSLSADPPPSKLAKALAQLDGPAGALMGVLARHPWLCALTYETLEPSATLQAGWKFDYVFELPDTFVKLCHCSADRFEVGSIVTSGGAAKKVIRADVASVDVAYTEVKPYAAWAPDLLNALAYELAARCAGPIQDNAALGRALAKLATDAIAAAETGEANQWGGEEPQLGGAFAVARQAGAY